MIVVERLRKIYGGIAAVQEVQPAVELALARLGVSSGPLGD